MTGNELGEVRACVGRTTRVIPFGRPYRTKLTRDQLR
jgi:hypothetical protein